MKRLKLFFPLLCSLGGLLACGRAAEQPEQPATPPADHAAPASTVAPAAPDTVAAPVLSAAELARQQAHEKYEAQEQARQDTIKRLNALIQVRFPEFRVADFTSGDINADGRRDVVVVAEGACVPVPGFDSTHVYRQRMALLLLNQGAFRLRIAAVNHDGLVNRVSCAEPTYEGYEYVEVQARTFTFHGHQPHTGYDVVFRYDRARRDWFLYRRIRTDYGTATINYYHVQRETPRNFGRVRFADYDGGVMEF